MAKSKQGTKVSPDGIERTIKASLDKADAERTEAPVAPDGAFRVQSVVFGLLINTKVTHTDGEPVKMEGDWYVSFIDTEEGAYLGAYRMYDQQGQPLSGYVPLEALKAAARQIYRNHADYEAVRLSIYNQGTKFMSTLVYRTQA